MIEEIGITIYIIIIIYRYYTRWVYHTCPKDSLSTKGKWQPCVMVTRAKWTEFDENKQADPKVDHERARWSTVNNRFMLVMTSNLK